MKQSNLNTDASHLTYTGKMRPWVRRLEITIMSFTMPFAQSAQSAEMLPNTLWHTDQKRLFVVYEHDRFAVLSLFCLLFLLDAGGYFS